MEFNERSLPDGNMDVYCTQCGKLAEAVSAGAMYAGWKWACVDRRHPGPFLPQGEVLLGDGGGE